MSIFMDESRKQQKQEQREKHYEELKRIIADTENNRYFKTENATFSEWQGDSYRRSFFPVLCFSILYSLFGCAFLSLGICITCEVILQNMIGLGILFIFISVAIFASLYPFCKKIQSLQKSYSPQDFEEE